jgi:hypothetical protein
MEGKDAELLTFACAADTTARFTGADGGEPHSGRALAKSFVKGPFSQVVGRERTAIEAVVAIEVAADDYMKSLGDVAAQGRAIASRALHLSKARIAGLIAEDSSGASRIKEALVKERADSVGAGAAHRSPTSGKHCSAWVRTVVVLMFGVLPRERHRPSDARRVWVAEALGVVRRHVDAAGLYRSRRRCSVGVRGSCGRCDSESGLGAGGFGPWFAHGA